MYDVLRPLVIAVLVLTEVGLWQWRVLIAGQRLTPGWIGVTVVSDTPGIAEALWARGWAVTAQPGFGENGPVTVLSVSIDGRHEARLHGDVIELAPGAAWSAEDHRKRPSPARAVVAATTV